MLEEGAERESKLYSVVAVDEALLSRVSKQCKESESKVEELDSKVEELQGILTGQSFLFERLCGNEHGHHCMVCYS